MEWGKFHWWTTDRRYVSQQNARLLVGNIAYSDEHIMVVVV